MADKPELYSALVSCRKACTACAGLSNVASYEAGAFDSAEIGPWTRWQADLDARVMVIGQDWGDRSAFVRQKGVDVDSSATNQVLRELLASVGLELSPPQSGQPPERRGVFLTNAILCLKAGGAQADVLNAWFDTCGVRFLKPQIELVNPPVVVCLGERAYRAVLRAFGIRPRPFRQAVDAGDFERLPHGSVVVPVYHCGRRILNTHRGLSAQFNDWRRVANALQLAGSSARDI